MAIAGARSSQMACLYSSNQGISFAIWNPSIEGTFANGTAGSSSDLYSIAPDLVTVLSQVVSS